MPPPLESHPEIMRKRKAMVEQPLGTIKRWMDPGDFRRRGQKQVSPERRWSLRAYNSTRVLNSLGVPTRLEALACNGWCTSLRGHQHRTSRLPVHPSQLAFDRGFQRLISPRVLVISQFARKFSHSLVCG